MLKLDRRDYALALPLLSQVKINTLFAEAVLKGQTTGTVYVDNVQNPVPFMWHMITGCRWSMGIQAMRRLTGAYMIILPTRQGTGSLRNGCRETRQEAGLR